MQGFFSVILHIVFAILATGRLTELFTQDLIFAPIRNRLIERSSTDFWRQFWSCSRCWSIWSGELATIGLFLLPKTIFPFPFAWIYLVIFPLTFSMIYLLVGELMGILARRTTEIASHGRKITIEPTPAGLRVDWAGYDPKHAASFLKDILFKLEPPPPPLPPNGVN